MIYEEDDEAVDETGREHETVRSRESNMGTVALALMAGAAIGAAVALMMAPRSGQDMRRVIRKRAQGLRDTAGHVIDDTADELRRQVRRRGRQMRRQMERMG